MSRLYQFAILFLLSVTASNCFGDWGNLTGTFLLDGDVPAADKIAVTKDEAVCRKGNLVEETLVVDPKTKGIADIIVYMYTSRGPKPKIHPDYAKTAKDKVALDNILCRFEPRVTLLRTTQTLMIGNKDPVGHNTKIDALSNPGINPLIPANGQLAQKFTMPERRPLVVGCNIHPWMSGRLVIQDHPYMAKSDKQGKFKIEKIPAGEWTFQFIHESGYIGSKDGLIKVDGTPKKWSKGREAIKIVAGKDTNIGKVSIIPSFFQSN